MRLDLPDEQCSYNQHGSQVNSQGCLKKERFEEGRGVGDSEQEKRWKVGCQQLIGQAALENYLHFYAILDIIYNNYLFSSLKGSVGVTLVCVC